MCLTTAELSMTRRVCLSQCGHAVPLLENHQLSPCKGAGRVPHPSPPAWHAPFLTWTSPSLVQALARRPDRRSLLQDGPRLAHGHLSSMRLGRDLHRCVLSRLPGLSVSAHSTWNRIPSAFFARTLPRLVGMLAFPVLTDASSPSCHLSAKGEKSDVSWGRFQTAGRSRGRPSQGLTLIITTHACTHTHTHARAHTHPQAGRQSSAAQAPQGCPSP